MILAKPVHEQFRFYIKKGHYPFFQETIKPYLGESKASERRNLHRADNSKPAYVDPQTCSVLIQQMYIIMKTEVEIRWSRYK